MSKIRLLLCVVLVPLVLLAGCGGGGPRGTYVNLGDAEDRIELDGGSGRVAALRGQNIDVWQPPVAAARGVAGELQAAQRALRQIEMVEVEVQPRGSGRTLRLIATDGRGSRLPQIDPQSDEILTGGQRRHFRR